MRVTEVHEDLSGFRGTILFIGALLSGTVTRRGAALSLQVWPWLKKTEEGKMLV